MTIKLFKTEKTAKAAVKREGIQNMTYVVENHCSSIGTGFVVRVYVHDLEDYDEIRRRGFMSEINREKAAI